MATLFRIIVVSTALLFSSALTFGQTADKDYEARLRAGKEAAYQKYLLQPAPSPTAAPTPRFKPAEMIPPHTYYARREAAVRSSRAVVFEPSIFQPLYDSRYRREWPRPFTRRVYTPAHYAHDGQRYRYVPSSVHYETIWGVYSRDRYHFEGSHYRIVSQFDW